MIIVADSGSTKTDWRIIDSKGKVYRKQTIGFNPYIVSAVKMHQELKNNLIKQIAPEWISEIYFYGAGCSTPDKKEFIRYEISRIYPNAKIVVNHDILGAARALLGKNAGLIGILGTGSNCCYFNGSEISKIFTSCGWILGDEGSGNHLGRLLIRDYLSDRLPADILKKFNETFKTNHNEILDVIYKKPLPNRYLAGFSKFMKENEESEYINGLVTYSFNEYFERQVKLFDELKCNEIHFVGSVAHYFEAQLKEVAKKFNYSVGIINKKPIDNLVDFHKNL